MRCRFSTQTATIFRGRNVLAATDGDVARSTHSTICSRSSSSTWQGAKCSGSRSAQDGDDGDRAHLNQRQVADGDDDDDATWGWRVSYTSVKKPSKVRKRGGFIIVQVVVDQCISSNIFTVAHSLWRVELEEEGRRAQRAHAKERERIFFEAHFIPSSSSLSAQLLVHRRPDRHKTVEMSDTYKDMAAIWRNTSVP